jgi:hypothetical protein
MKTGLAIAFAGLCLAASLTPLMAHHSTSSTYDKTRVITIRGIVTGIDWRNPHVRIHLDVIDADNRIVNWDVETLGTRELNHIGLDNGFLKPSDQVSIDVFLARDGTPRAVVRALTLPDGRTMDDGRSLRFER